MNALTCALAVMATISNGNQRGPAERALSAVVTVGPILGSVRPDFLSFTMDAACLKASPCTWPCPAPGELDPVTLDRIALLAPMVLRVGGTYGDNVDWAGDGTVRPPVIPAVEKALGPPGNLTLEKLEAILRFGDAVGGKVVLALNGLQRTAGNASQWDARNAHGLMAAIVANQLPLPYAFELGNEPGYWQSNKWSSLSPQAHAQDFGVLRPTISSVLGGSAPLIAGPDVALVPGGGEAAYLEAFWSNSTAPATPLVDYCTIHLYPLIDSSVAASYADFYNSSKLDRARTNTRAARHATPSRIPLWVGEGSPDWRVTGSLGRNLSFEMAYVDMAGSIAAEGAELFARQCLNSVVNPKQDVEPGYWVVYMWKQLMGTRVHNASQAQGPGPALPQPLRAYCHSTSTGTRLTVLIVNINDQAVAVDLVLPTGVAVPAVRSEFHFGQNSTTDAITINGVVPEFTDNGAGRPDVPGSTRSTTEAMIVEARSFAFATFDLAAHD